MPRTGSIGSKVGPAVTSTRLPASGLGSSSAAISVEDLGRLEHAAHADLAARLVARRGAERSRTPSARSALDVALRRRVVPHLAFIAGATSSGQSRARHSVDSRSSARPCASLAMKSALAGATTIELAVARELDVRHVVGDAAVPQVGEDRLARQRLQRHRGDEPAAGFGHRRPARRTPALTSRRHSSAAL